MVQGLLVGHQCMSTSKALRSTAMQHFWLSPEFDANARCCLGGVAYQPYLHPTLVCSKHVLPFEMRRRHTQLLTVWLRPWRHQKCSGRGKYPLKISTPPFATWPVPQMCSCSVPGKAARFCHFAQCNSLSIEQMLIIVLFISIHNKRGWQ